MFSSHKHHCIETSMGWLYKHRHKDANSCQVKTQVQQGKGKGRGSLLSERQVFSRQLEGMFICQIF